jgi:hypothetical protein
VGGRSRQNDRNPEKKVCHDHVVVTPFVLDDGRVGRRALSTDAATELTSDALLDIIACLPLGAIAGASPVSLKDSKALFTTT